jgi:YggT family protein
MAEQIYETREAVSRTPEGAVRQTVTATNDPVRPYATAVRLIDWLTSALLALLAIRFALSALGANQGNAFASFIYNLSYPFVAPFFGLFGYTMQYGVARFELETLVAIAVYALVGYGLARLVAATRGSRV